MDFNCTEELMNRLEVAAENGSAYARDILQYLRSDQETPTWLEGRWRLRKKVQNGEVYSVSIVHVFDGRAKTISIESFLRMFTLNKIVNTKTFDCEYEERIKFSNLFKEYVKIHIRSGSSYEFIKNTFSRLKWGRAGYSDEWSASFTKEPYITMFAEFFTKLAPCTVLAFESETALEGVGIVWDDVYLSKLSANAGTQEAIGSLLEVPIYSGYSVISAAEEYALSEGIQTKAIGTSVIRSLVHRYTAPYSKNRGYSEEIHQVSNGMSLQGRKKLQIDLTYRGGMPFDFALPTNILYRDGDLWWCTQGTMEDLVMRSVYPNTTTTYKRICPICGSILKINAECPECKDNAGVAQTIFGPVYSARLKKVKNYGYFPSVFVGKTGDLTKAAKQFVILNLLAKPIEQ